MQMRQLARRQLRRIDLDDLDHAGLDLLFEIDAEARAAREQRVRAFVEHEHDRLLAAPGGRDAELRGDGRLAGAGAADDQRAGAFFDAAAEQRRRAPATLDGSFAALPALAVLGRDQPREHLEAALA